MSAAQTNLVRIIGIANCDTVRKARRWLDDRQIDHDFRDLRKTPLDVEEMTALLQEPGPEQLINRRSTSWRALSDEQKELVQQTLNQLETRASSSGSIKSSTHAGLVGLMLANQTMIKRPVLLAGGKILCGFSQSEWGDLFDL